MLIPQLRAYYIHFILTDNGQLFKKELTCFVPKVGEEIRVDNKIYSINHVVWVMDEPEAEESGWQRVNIGIEEVVFNTDKEAQWT